MGTLKVWAVMATLAAVVLGSFATGAALARIVKMQREAGGPADRPVQEASLQGARRTEVGGRPRRAGDAAPVAADRAGDATARAQRRPIPGDASTRELVPAGQAALPEAPPPSMAPAAPAPATADGQPSAPQDNPPPPDVGAGFNGSGSNWMDWRAGDREGGEHEGREREGRRGERARGFGFGERERGEREGGGDD